MDILEHLGMLVPDIEGHGVITGRASTVCMHNCACMHLLQILCIYQSKKSKSKNPTHLGLGGLVEPGERLQHVEDEHVAAELEAELAQGRGHRSHNLELVSEIRTRLRTENKVGDINLQLI